MDWTPVWAVVGALVGATGTFLGVVVTQRETLRRERELRLWERRATVYVELIRWTAWVQHWFIVGAPDPHERPLTVTMARTASAVTALGDDVTGAKAFRLLELLVPEVSAQDISGKAPPHGKGIEELADEIAALAKAQLAGVEPARRRSALPFRIRASSRQDVASGQKA